MNALLAAGADRLMFAVLSVTLMNDNAMLRRSGSQRAGTVPKPQAPVR